ncbi:hypothetical protein PUR71_35530 [Streptomyces sp. SP17BM10]|uniref:hypothetical protein n=1 Tax=Streptomyces sp. SP17BM10 TaxID=3002530 RepID=UPI002E7688F5|nr:hypothetical protein [Streptomyces sp. SP17BM10]MEE1788172.1 hypothetical protein [Streptomyces sp. SP17BM10]
MTAAQRRTLTAVFASAGILLGTAACSSSPAAVPGPGALSYDTVRSTAQKLHQDRQNTCPFGLDLGKALKAAGLPDAVDPDTGNGSAVDGDVGDGLPPQPWPSGASHPPEMPSVPATPPHADITCAYRAGGGSLEIELMAVPKAGVALNLLLPRVQRQARASVSQLRQLATQQPGPGQTVLAPGSGTAALARPVTRGEGDIVLMLSENSSGDTPDPAFTGEPLRRAAEALAGQLR